MDIYYFSYYHLFISNEKYTNNDLGFPIVWPAKLRTLDIERTDLSIANHLVDGVHLFPNPTTGLVNIEHAENATIMVYNQVGALIETVSNTNQIDLSSFDNGIYIVKVIANNSANIKRIVLTK